MKHFGETESLLSSAVEKETYNTIGNTYENNRGDQKKRKPVCCLIACLLILAVTGFALLTTVLLLYDLNVFESSCLHSGNNLALSEDYILLLHSCQNKFRSTEKLLYKNSIQFFVNTSINPVEIFSISCNSLTLMVDQFPKSQSHQNSTLNTLPQQVYFKNCSNYTGICILDEFVYQVLSNNSAIIYNITLDFYNPNETNVWIVAFDNFMNFNNFLITGGKMSNSLKSLKMADTSAIFILDSSDMRRSSYYFFAVKTFKNTNWFIKTSAGTRVFYNISNATPDCVLTARKNFCEIEIRESNQCYLGHVKDNATEGEKLTIHHQPVITKQGYTLLALTLGMAFFLIIIVLLVIATIKMLHSKRKKSKLSTCSVHKNGYKSGHKTIEKIPFDENGLLHHWPVYGITIFIPEGAVIRSASLQFEASFLSTNFKCGGTFRPVSPFVWIHFDQELVKPAKLYIPHDVVIENDEQLRKLHILTRNHDANASFKVNNELDAEITNEIVCVRAKHFCSLCLAAALEGEELKTKYHMIYAEKHCEDEVLLDICILQSRICRKPVEKYYEERGFKCSSTKKVYFKQGDEGIRYSVELTDNVGWNYTERGATQSKIQQKHVDVYKFLEVSAEEITQKCIIELEECEAEGEYPPRFKLRFFKESEFIKKKSAVKIVLHGLDPEVSISFMINNEGSPGASLEDSFTDSAIYETIPFLKSMLKNEQQLFFKFCHSLGLDQDLSQQIFSSAGPDINSCLKEALTEWRKSSHCTVPLKDIARALASSTGVDITMHMEDDYVMIADTREISLKYFSDIPDSTSQRNHPIYDILCSLPSSSKLNSEPEYHDFDTHIATKLPLKWERFGTHLKMSQPDLEIIKANRSGDIVMCFYDLFNKWKRSSCSSFTWATVLAVLCYLDEYRAAKDLCKYL